MKKYFLRAPFSIDLGDRVVIGPCEIELDEKKAKLEQHKIEPVAEKPVEKKKKAAE